MASCPLCFGTKFQLLMNSWFINDGLRREKCHLCAGTGIAVRGVTSLVKRSAFLRDSIRAQVRFRERAKLWGGLKPKVEASR